MHEVVRRGLVGDEIGHHAAGARTPHEFGQHLGRIAEQADRDRLLARAVLLHECERVVEIARLLVEVARAQAEVEARLLALDVQRHGPGERRGERLRTAHAAEPRRQDPAPAPGTVEVLAAGFAERLVRALHDALAADVDP